MHRPVGTAAVRLSLWMLVFAALATSLVQPAQAGSAAAPEIADPANDQELLGTVPISQQPPAGTTLGLNSDILFAWVEEISATTLQFTIDVQGTAGPTSSSVTTWTFHFEIGGTAYDASASQQAASPAGDGSTAPGGVAATATAGDGLIVMTVEKSAIGNPAGGAILTNLFATASAAFVGQVDDFTSDRAPNEGAGSDYTLPGGSGGGGSCPNCTADDTDGDGLNDTWEQQYFGNVTAQNATGDPDGDGLTNGQEQELGTDPTKADTDGDGVGDKDDPFPLDPARGGTSTTTSTSTGTGTGSATATSTTGSRTTTTTGIAAGGGDDGDGEVKSLGDAIERLESNVGYLGMSAGGFLAVLILCIAALATRWSL